MKVKMLTALVGPEINYRSGDIVETPEGASWCEAGIAMPHKEAPVETASKPLAKETAAKKVTAKASIKETK